MRTSVLVLVLPSTDQQIIPACIKKIDSLPALFYLRPSDEWWRQLRLKQSTRGGKIEVLKSEIKVKRNRAAASVKGITR